MSKNQIIVIVILLASALLLNLITKEDHTPVEMKILFERVVSSVIDETTIDEIEIYKGKDLPEKTLFRRSGEVWIYPDKFNSPLMKQKITDLVKTLNSMEGQVRSEDPNLVGEYMLGERESIHLVFNKGGQPLLHLLMGMKGSGWQTCFVRQKDSGKVYFVDNSNPLAKLGVYTRAVDGTIDGNTFVDKNLMTMREELKKVTLKTADREICVELVEEALPQEGTKPVEIKKRWTLPSHPDLQADEKKIAEWVGGLKSLWVQDYIDPALKDSYQLGTMTVTLEGANGVKNILNFGPPKGGVFPVCLAGQPYLCTIPENTIKRFDKSIDGLIVAPAKDAGKKNDEGTPKRDKNTVVKENNDQKSPVSAISVTAGDKTNTPPVDEKKESK